jgi:hypothetical protein
MRDASSLKSPRPAGSEDTWFFENQVFKYEQAAKFLQISVRQLKDLKKNGAIPWVPIGARGVRFQRASLCRYLNEREVS